MEPIDQTTSDDGVAAAAAVPNDPRLDVATALDPPDGEPIDSVRLESAVSILLADPHMHNVEFAAETEEWLAYALAENTPATDDVIPLAASHFNWMEELGTARRRPVVAYLAQRADDLSYIAALRDSEHPWHEAFAHLQHPAPEAIPRHDWQRLCQPITGMLESIRYHHPAIESLFDAQHVAMWCDYVYLEQQPQSRMSIGAWLGLIWLGIMLLGYLGRTAAG